MPTNTLTDAKCKSAKAAAKPVKLFDGHGLYLLVNPSGTKLWRMSYRFEGKPQTASFGPYPLLTLADARTRRDEVRKQLAEGKKPGATEKPAEPEKKIPTLREASDTYWSGRKDVSSSYLDNAKRALDMHVFPLLGAKPVNAIDRKMVMEALGAMDAKGLYVYVRKTRMWLGQVFDWAVEQEHMEINPCALIDPRKAFGHAPVESFAALSLRDVPAFMERLDLEGLVQSAQACRLLALTWVRTNELRQMEWSEIEGTDLWRIPAGKMKRRKEHLVPLSTQAQEILENMRKRRTVSPYVFPNARRQDRPMSENSVLYLIGRMGYAGQMTGHGFRSVGSTWANENGFDKDAIERQLAHSPEDKVRAVYNRAEFLPDRKAMLQAWADWLMGAGPKVEDPAARG